MRGLTITAMGIVAALFLAANAPAWADITVNVAEPTGNPGPGNDYNSTVVSDANGTPLDGGETITFTSTSEIESVSAPHNPGASAGSPVQLSNGGTNVDVKIGGRGGIDSVIIRYKSGKKRLVLIVTGATSVTMSDRHMDPDGSFHVTVNVQWIYGDKYATELGFRNWGPPTASPTPSAPITPGHSEGKGE